MLLLPCSVSCRVLPLLLSIEAKFFSFLGTQCMTRENRRIKNEQKCSLAHTLTHTHMCLMCDRQILDLLTVFQGTHPCKICQEYAPSEKCVKRTGSQRSLLVRPRTKGVHGRQSRAQKVRAKTKGTFQPTILSSSRVKTFPKFLTCCVLIRSSLRLKFPAAFFYVFLILFYLLFFL